MKTLALFVKPPGTSVSLRTAQVGAGVMTYVVFVQGWTRKGKKPVATWFSDDLESTGRTIVLDDIRGYDLILKPTVTANATIDVTLSFDGVADAARTVKLPLPDGATVEVVAREFSIVVR